MQLFILIQLTLVLIIFILTLVGLSSTVRYFIYKKKFNDWPAVSVEIIHSELLEKIEANIELDRAYIPDIKFKYKFRNKDYVSNEPVLSNHTLFQNHLEVEYLVEKYKKGDIVTAKVNPKVPEECFLEIGRFNIIEGIVRPIGIILFFIMVWLSLKYFFYYLY